MRPTLGRQRTNIINAASEVLKILRGLDKKQVGQKSVGMDVQLCTKDLIHHGLGVLLAHGGRRCF